MAVSRAAAAAQRHAQRTPAQTHPQGLEWVVTAAAATLGRARQRWLLLVLLLHGASWQRLVQPALAAAAADRCRGRGHKQPPRC